MNYETCFRDYQGCIEKTLEEVIPPANRQPFELHKAMRYAVFTGGKRFRPFLTLAACEANGGKIEQALYPAVAVELIHSYSLIHDDLPALDNDDLRRGKPTCHKEFGEATAILAGDALLTLAFHVLSRVHPSERTLKLLAELSTEAGSYGMIGGQVADLTVGQEGPDLAMLDYISIHKTGKLIKASVVCGAIAADASEKACLYMLKFGELLGMAFQSIDDLMDGDGYLRLMKAQEVRDKARDLIAQAKREIRSFGAKAEKLHQLTDYLIGRIPEGTHVAMD